ncbi:MAG: hypothetical protein JXA18_00005, partial [Chitinispirillaceae bacterium]|nr:hypothetical protein [Chitinispirillaceae bacterium]
TGLGESAVTMLPNPVGNSLRKTSSASSGALRSELKLLSRGDGLHFDQRRRLYLYPSRMIYRKNALEALLLATILLEGSLVTGACGCAAADRRRMAAVMRIARRYRLSLAVDPSRLPVQRNVDPAVKARDPFFPLYWSADCICTASLAEGFGYSLVDPWAYGRTVIGRRPAGTSLLPGMESIPLYDRLPVPCSWVPVEECYRRFAAAYDRAFGKRYVSMQWFRTSFVREDTIDFGILDDRLQADVITRLLRCDADRAALESLLKEPAEGWPGTTLLNRPDERLLNRMRRVVRQWDNNSFDSSFVKCLARRTRPPWPPAWYRRIAAFYRQHRNFRLISPERLSRL